MSDHRMCLLNRPPFRDIGDVNTLIGTDSDESVDCHADARAMPDVKGFKHYAVLSHCKGPEDTAMSKISSALLTCRLLMRPHTPNASQRWRSLTVTARLPTYTVCTGSTDGGAASRVASSEPLVCATSTVLVCEKVLAAESETQAQ